MIKLKVENLSKKFDDNIVVSNVSFDVSNKDFVVLLGPSGCGKTTILNMIAGLEQPTSGNIIIDDLICNELSAQKRNTAMVFQNYALYPHMKVYDNIAFPLRNQKFKKEVIDEKVKEMAKLLGIEHYLNKYPNQLSGGEKQRVAIGRALVRNPSIFLMDEPLSNLDTELRNQMRNELQELRKKIFVPIIYVTHDQIEALTLATKIIVLNSGVIQQIGTSAEIFNFPKNKFVAQFIGTPKINIFNKVKINKINNKLLINIFEQKIELPKRRFYKYESIDVAVYADLIKVKKIKCPIDSCLYSSIKYIDFLGHEKMLTCQTLGENNSCKVVVENNLDFQIGDKLQLIFNKHRLMFFDGKTGNRI